MIIFAQPRHLYDSYQDFRALVQLAGFPLIYVDEIPREGVRENVYILSPLNGEWQNGIRTDGRVIWWDLEWRCEGDFPRIPGVSEVWTSDAWYAAKTGTRYVPMGSDKRLRLTPDRIPTEYDAAYLGYMVNRRSAIQHELRARGLRITGHGAWGIERDYVLNASTVYLHVHQLDQAPGVPALRMVVAAAYGLPVISETVADVGIFGHAFLQCVYGRLGEFVQLWARDQHPQMRENYGHSLHTLLCEKLTFRKSVEDAL